MKTAISLPDDLFAEAESLVRRKKVSRSRLFSDALREYVRRHDPEAVTEAMNVVCDAVGEASDPFVREAARRVLERTEW